MYNDSIWLNDGATEVLRSFIIEVSNKNTHPLNKISFLIPRLIYNLQNFSNYSVDPNYFFNEEGRTTGEIRIINKHRVIFDDFDCRVKHGHLIEPHIFENTTKVDIDLRDDVLTPGRKELFLLKFNVYKFIKRLPNVNAFAFTYFCPETCKKM